MSYGKSARSIILLMVLFAMTGCASQRDETKLRTDMVILTQKIQALTVELKMLKEKQLQEQQLKAQQETNAAKIKTEIEKKS